MKTYEGDDIEQSTLELTVYVLGSRAEALKLRDDILIDLKRTYGIRKLGDMGTHVTLEYRPPEFEWTLATALSQIEKGKTGPKHDSAMAFLHDFYIAHAQKGIPL